MDDTENQALKDEFAAGEGTPGDDGVNGSGIELIAELKASLATAENEAIVALAEVENLSGELAAANGKIIDLQAKLEKAENAAKGRPRTATAKDAAAKPRRFKPIKDEDRVAAEDLRAQLAGADDVEIAFVDGKGQEIPGSKPVAISGDDAWAERQGGQLALATPVNITGAAEGSYAIAGYALVIDGKHVATQYRSEPFAVAPGSRIKLENDIAF